MSETAPVAEHHDETHADYSILVVGAALLALTVATSMSLILQWSPLWGSATNALFVLMISFFKASFVVGFFMHYRFEQNWKYFVTIPACILCVALVLALTPDIAHETYPKGPWSTYDRLAAEQ
jgi:caa(3)-type oxidase subunit IV